MKLNPDAAADILKTFIQEDRIEIRNHRTRLQNGTYTLAVGSFAISAFMIGKVAPMNVAQLRHVTLLIDFGLIALILIFSWRTQVDLMWVRKGLKARQDILEGLNEGNVGDVKVFPDPKNVTPDVKDRGLYWDVALSVVVVLAKALVLVAYADLFVASN